MIRCKTTSAGVKGGERMTIAIWIIAICEVTRLIQNSMQLRHLWKSEKMSANAYGEFIRHLKQSDKEFVKEMLEQFEKEHSMEGDE